MTDRQKRNKMCKTERYIEGQTDIQTVKAHIICCSCKKYRHPQSKKMCKTERQTERQTDSERNHTTLVALMKNKKQTNKKDS